MLPLEQEKMYMKAKNGASRESFSSFFFCSLSSIRFLIDWAGVGKKNICSRFELAVSVASGLKRAVAFS